MSSFIFCLNLVIVSFSGIYTLTKALFVKYERQILPVRYSKSQRTLKIGRMKENNTKSKKKPTESSDSFKSSESSDAPNLLNHMAYYITRPGMLH